MCGCTDEKAALCRFFTCDKNVKGSNSNRQEILMRFVSEKHKDQNLQMILNPKPGDLADERINTFVSIVVWVDKDRSLVGVGKRQDWITSEETDCSNRPTYEGYYLQGFKKITILSKQEYVDSLLYQGQPTVHIKRKAIDVENLFTKEDLSAALFRYENQHTRLEQPTLSESIEETG